MAPAVCGTAGDERAGVQASSVHGIDEQAAGDCRGDRAVGGRSVAELPGAVRAPAVGGSDARDSTSGEPPGVY